jgi:hypothetical protein
MKKYCANCKQSDPKNRCGHCIDTLYCGQLCANLHNLVHIGVILPVQIPNIPPKNLRIIKQTHREGVGVNPYTLSSIRNFISTMDGDVESFDRARNDALNFRKNEIKKIFESDDVETIFISEKENKYTKQLAGVYSFSKEPGESGIIPYLISPFISLSEIEAMLPAMKNISRIILNEKIPRNERDAAWKFYLKNTVMEQDDFISNWCLFNMMIPFKNHDPVLIGYASFSMTIYNAFLEAYSRLKSRYSLKGKVVFEKYQTRFAEVLIVPSNTFLYRGYSDGLAKDGLSISRQFDYFAFDFFTTDFYTFSNGSNDTVEEWLAHDSGVAVFQTQEAIRILDLTKGESVLHMQQQMIENDAPKKVIEAFKRAWKITPSGNVERSSGPSSDALIVEWMCSQGWDGYVGIGFDKFHDEIMLCQPRSVLKLIQNLKHSRDFVHDFTSLPHPVQKEAVIVEY